MFLTLRLDRSRRRRTRRRARLGACPTASAPPCEAVTDDSASLFSVRRFAPSSPTCWSTACSTSPPSRSTVRERASRDRQPLKALRRKCRWHRWPLRLRAHRLRHQGQHHRLLAQGASSGISTLLLRGEALTTVSVTALCAGGEHDGGRVPQRHARNCAQGVRPRGPLQRPDVQGLEDS